MNIGTSQLWLVGQILDGKSNVCPTLVQSPSKYCPKTGHVEGLSSHRPSTVQLHCQTSVKFQNTWTEIGQANPEIVESLSTVVENSAIFPLDKFWTDSGLGK